MAKVQKVPLVKFVKGALNTPLAKVDEPTGGVDQHWRQVDLINAPDSNLVLVSGLAEHTSKSTYEYYFWHHQVALILDGEMVIQDLDTGGVYRAQKGDLFYWAPGLRVKIGGNFRAFFVKTPVPMRWVRTPDGKKREVVTQTLESEILLPGTPPQETRKEPLMQA